MEELNFVKNFEIICQIETILWFENCFQFYLDTPEIFFELIPQEIFEDCSEQRQREILNEHPTSVFDAMNEFFIYSKFDFSTICIGCLKIILEEQGNEKMRKRFLEFIRENKFINEEKLNEFCELIETKKAFDMSYIDDESRTSNTNEESILSEDENDKIDTKNSSNKQKKFNINKECLIPLGELILLGKKTKFC